jgi:hypothetical protein
MDHWRGPQLNGRVPSWEYKAAAQCAAQLGITRSLLVRNAVREYLQRNAVDPAVNAVSGPSALPQAKRQRADTGKSERITTLQGIDSERRAQSGTAVTFV